LRLFSAGPGQSGFGPEATRYALGVELHDVRRFDEIVEVMTPYFQRIARGHREHNREDWEDDFSNGSPT